MLSNCVWLYYAIYRGKLDVPILLGATGMITSCMLGVTMMLRYPPKRDTSERLAILTGFVVVAALIIEIVFRPFPTPNFGLDALPLLSVGLLILPGNLHQFFSTLRSQQPGEQSIQEAGISGLAFMTWIFYGLKTSQWGVAGAGVLMCTSYAMLGALLLSFPEKRREFWQGPTGRVLTRIAA